MNRPFKLLVFDWDGTLMDSEARIVASFNAAMTDVGSLPLPDAAVRDIIGLALPEALQQLVPDADSAVRQRLVERYRHHYLYASPVAAQLFPGAADTVRELRQQGYLLAVATGKGRRGLDSVLVETGCTDFFHTTRCADETFSKPHPRMLLEIMEELEVNAQDTLMIGDTEYDMRMAQNAGTAALAVSYGSGFTHDAPQRLLQWGALACVDSMDEVREWLRVYATSTRNPL